MKDWGKKIGFGLLVTMMIISMVMRSPYRVNAQQLDRTGNFFQGLGQGLVDEAVLKQIQSASNAACSLYGLGVEVVNFFDLWSFQNSLVDASVLFRNEDWRNLIWAIDDRRDAIRDELVALSKQQCVLNFSLPALRLRNADQAVQQTEIRLIRVADRIDQLEKQNDYFAIQKRKMTFDKPQFFRYGDGEQVPDEFLPLTSVPTDQIYYFLIEAPLKVDWQQYANDTREFFQGRLGPSFQVFFEQIPEGCFAVGNVLEDQLELFLYATNAKFQQSEYKNFRTFLQERKKNATQTYGSLCENKGKVSPTRSIDQPTSLEEQYQRFADRLSGKIEFYGKHLVSLEQEIGKLEQLKLRSGLSEADAKKLQNMKEDRSWVMAAIDYDTLVLSTLSAPGQSSIAQIGNKLASLVEAITGIQRDQQGRLSSRLSLAERFEARQQKTLENICTRIETMYRQSGRSTADLPIIGTANGKTYCRARPNCADVNLLNLSGVSEGRSKLLECSGFLFNSSELGVSQRQQSVIRQDAEDIGRLLEQQSLDQLYGQRDLHYQSLRNRYSALFASSSDAAAELDQVVRDVSKDLYDPQNTASYEPNKQQAKTQYTLLKKIYHDLYLFSSKQPGYCPAEENPE